MYIVNARNINDAYRYGLGKIVRYGKRENSRNGNVLVLDAPLATVYEQPLERVLLSKHRRCNPFFHLFESLWMLAGKNDLEFLVRFNKKMAEYSDDGELVRGSAYGFRWRKWFDFDQLEFIIREIKDNPASRRLVLSQWSTEDLRFKSKDLPCNTHVYFRVRKNNEPPTEYTILDMTVCCRSNDMLFGGYGSNVVHFSMLQEYIANACELDIGTYTQISNNAHLYTDTEVYKRICQYPSRPESIKLGDYPGRYPFLFTKEEKDAFDRDCDDFCADPERMPHRTAFFTDVVNPMYACWKAVKEKDYGKAQVALEDCRAPDWQIAAQIYIEQRGEKNV